MILTWPKLDCLEGSALIIGIWDENCCAKTDRLRVTDRASLANLLSPLLASSSIGCFSAVISRNVSKNSTTTSFSFLIGAMCNRSHNGVPDWN